MLFLLLLQLLPLLFLPVAQNLGACMHEDPAVTPGGGASGHSIQQPAGMLGSLQAVVLAGGAESRWMEASVLGSSVKATISVANRHAALTWHQLAFLCHFACCAAAE